MSIQTAPPQPTAVRPEARKGRSPQRLSDTQRTLLLTGLCFAALLGTDLRAWSSVGLGGFDLGIFDQGVRGYAHFGLPVSTLKYFHHEFPPGFSLLGDHFSPILALLAPLYWVWDDPRSLLLGQALLFAAGVPLVRRISDHAFAAAEPVVRRRARDLAGLVFGLGWPLLVASQVGFHEVGFAVPLTLLMLERGMAREYRPVVLAAVLLCCTKEDMGLVVAAYGLVLLWRGRGSAAARTARQTGGWLLVSGLATTAITVQWAIPTMGGEPGYYWHYDAVGPNAPAAALHVLTDPLVLLRAATDQTLKPLLLLWLFGTLFLLPLRSATALCAVPLLAERILSSNPNHWSVARHYDAFLWPILLTATIEVLGRLHGRGRPRRVQWLGIGLAGVSLATAVPLGLAELAIPSQWSPGPRQVTLLKATALIPDGAWVEADNQIAPRLTARDHVVLVDQTPRGCEYVLIRSLGRSFPFATDQQQRDRIRLLLAHGYRQVWGSNGVVLLHRWQSEPVPGEHVPVPGGKPVQDVVPADVGHNLFEG
ncbi:DUF2079 domain-containing protein [Kitasatospora acidiphila]|uniref:DUF2079 domain-containing protein n=1 Tax=Kitasatospora acidiphila TaxID=2567942 RepID=A0A540W9M0_9ACTN|nr:DUF2079 domain-containing protein [Kitasatospora acidiphila]TQF05719.1 DUF2079 domain-containing protein [Kitasatospora acidiphila]